MKVYHLFEYLVADSIYCLTSIIRIYQVFGVSFIHCHSLLASIYFHRAQWCELYSMHISMQRQLVKYFKRRELKSKKTKLFNGVLKKKRRTSRLYEKVIELLGPESMINLNPLFNYEKGMSHYKKAIETHEQKYTYNYLIDNMYFLDNDFADDYTHFHCALERSLMLTDNQFETKILDIELRFNEIKETYEGQDIFDLEIYYKR